jgi:hypothetical protein
MFNSMLKGSSLSIPIFMVILTLILVQACGWDDEITFPENFKETYTQITSCEISQHPKANSAITWVSPSGESVWEQLVMAHQNMMEEGMDNVDEESEDVQFEPGTVVVKVQYSDTNCSTLSGYTAMEKQEAGTTPTLGDWRWQFLDETGACNDCNAGVSCSGCHSAQPACTQSPEFFCTAPH